MPAYRGSWPSYAGIAAIPVWCGNTTGRVRLTSSGKRQLNAAIHRIAVTQIRIDGLGKIYYDKKRAIYYDKKRAEGMSTPRALRCLKRRLARTVYHRSAPTTRHEKQSSPSGLT